MGGFGGRRSGGGHPDFGWAFSDVFEDLFGDMMGARAGGGGRARATRGQDLRYNLPVTLEEAFGGLQKTISVPARSPATNATAPGPKARSNP